MLPDNLMNSTALRSYLSQVQEVLKILGHFAAKFRFAQALGWNLKLSSLTDIGWNAALHPIRLGRIWRSLPRSELRKSQQVEENDQTHTSNMPCQKYWCQEENQLMMNWWFGFLGIFCHLHFRAKESTFVGSFAPQMSKLARQQKERIVSTVYVSKQSKHVLDMYIYIYIYMHMYIHIVDIDIMI